MPGDIVTQIPLPIDDADTAATLTGKMVAATGQMLAKTLPTIADGFISTTTSAGRRCSHRVPRGDHRKTA